MVSNQIKYVQKVIENQRLQIKYRLFLDFYFQEQNSMLVLQNLCTEMYLLNRSSVPWTSTLVKVPEGLRICEGGPGGKAGPEQRNRLFRVNSEEIGLHFRLVANHRIHMGELQITLISTSIFKIYHRTDDTPM